MTRPSDFILSSDYTTMKNQGTATVSVVMPGSVVISAGASQSYSADLTIGVKGALTRGRIQSTGSSSNWYTANHVAFGRTGTSSGSPAPYDLSAFFWRPDATTLRCQLLIQNPYGDTLTTVATETITFYANVFIPPFG